MIDRNAIEAMIPHKGAMCLWDHVLDWSGTRIHLRANNHRDATHPLRSQDRLRAQASSGQARPGMLVALRGVTLHVTRIDDLPGALECEAEMLVEGESSQQYAFRILHAGNLLAEGRAAVMLGAPAAA